MQKLVPGEVVWRVMRNARRRHAFTTGQARRSLCGHSVIRLPVMWSVPLRSDGGAPACERCLKSVERHRRLLSSRCRTLLGSVLLVIALSCGGDPDVASTGDACESGGDCQGDVCLVQLGEINQGEIIFPGGYCSSSCDEDADCADGEVCLIHRPTGDAFCFTECDVAVELLPCRVGYECVCLGFFCFLNAGTHVCLPAE